MTLDDTLNRTAGALTAGAAPGPGPDAARARSRQRTQRRRGTFGAGLGIFVVVVIIAGSWSRSSDSRPVSAEGAAILEQLARTAQAHGSGQSIDASSVFVFEVSPSDADQLPHRVDGPRGQALATTTVEPDGSGTTSSPLADASVETGFSPGDGPAFTVDMALVRRLAGGQLTAAEAIGAAAHEGVSSLEAAGALLTQPGLAGAVRSELISAILTISGVSASSSGTQVEVAAGSTTVVFDAGSSAVVGLSDGAEGWTIVSARVA